MLTPIVIDNYPSDYQRLMSAFGILQTNPKAFYRRKSEQVP